MQAVCSALRSDLAARWRALLGLALLLGLVGGAVLACAAGARRTDTAYGRLLTWAHASQLQIVEPTATSAYYRAVRKLPGIESVSEEIFDDAALPAAHRPSAIQVTALSSPDNSFGVRTDRVKILAGRMWRPADPRAVMVDQQLAVRYHLRPGSVFRLSVIPSNPLTSNAELGKAVVVTATVTAVVAFDNQIVPATAANAEPAVLLSPSFARTSLAASASYGTALAVQLRPGASVAGVTAAATALAQANPIMKAAGGVYVSDLTAYAAATQRAIRPEAVALGAFAALAGLILLAVAGQLLSRQLVLDSRDFPVLRALGMTPGQLLALSLARIAVVTAVGGALAVVVAIAASPLTPIGPARLAEPQPGLAVNVAILGLGLALIVLVPLALVLATAWRTARHSSAASRAADQAAPERSSRTADVLGAGGSLTRRIGVRMALQPGRGRTAVPVRSALVGTAIAVAAAVASLVFSASFVHLLDTPAQYGQDWQQDLDFGFGGLNRQFIDQIAARQPGLTEYAAGNYGQVSIDGTLVPAIGIDAFRGAGYLTMLSGHAPTTAGQLALGADTLRELHLRLGQQVPVVVTETSACTGCSSPSAGRSRMMTIVGTAVLAAFGQGSLIATDLGSGAVVQADVLSAPDPQTHCKSSCYNFLLARYRPTTSPRAEVAHLAAAATLIGCPPQQCVVMSRQQPSDVRNLAAVQDTPLVLGLVLALLAIGTLAHVLVTSVQRRRRDLAMLKVLGMDRAQVLSVVLWQACAVSLVALVAGIPVGVLAGRWAWTLFADSAGAPGGPTVPVLGLLAVIPATVLLAGLVATAPGRAAARIRPAAALRAE
jgi:ABC-type antimicrobial peptide transport system permease subunit